MHTLAPFLVLLHVAFSCSSFRIQVCRVLCEDSQRPPQSFLETSHFFHSLQSPAYTLPPKPGCTYRPAFIRMKASEERTMSTFTSTAQLPGSNTAPSTARCSRKMREWKGKKDRQGVGRERGQKAASQCAELGVGVWEKEGVCRQWGTRAPYGHSPRFLKSFKDIDK